MRQARWAYFPIADRCRVDPADGLPQQPRPDVRHAAFASIAPQSQAQQGDHAGAARTYEQLAAQNSGTEQNAFLLLAAREYLQARQADDAQRVLAAIAPPLTPDQTFERQMLGVELALARSQTQQAWQQLAAISEPRTNPAAARFFELKGRVAFAAGRPADAVRAEMARERWLANSQERSAARARSAALAARCQRARYQNRAAHRGGPRGPRLARAGRSGGLGRAGIPPRPRRRSKRGALAIRAIRPNEAVRSGAARPCEVGPVGARCARRAAAAAVGPRRRSGISVREGFMTAYYQAPPSERPRVRVYDTAELSAAEAIASASAEGAELIVGPLTRDEVTAAADLESPRPPILALNFLPADRPAPEGFYQFALSPEDEARQVARRVLAEGRKRGVALVPLGDWGTRVLAAFEQELDGWRRRLDWQRALTMRRSRTGHPRSRRCCASATATRATGASNPFSAASCSSSRAGAATSTSFSRRARPPARA